MNADDTDTTDEFADLTAATESSLEFWDNPIDDEDWKHAAAQGPAHEVSGLT